MLKLVARGARTQTAKVWRAPYVKHPPVLTSHDRSDGHNTMPHQQCGWCSHTMRPAAVSTRAVNKGSCCLPSARQDPSRWATEGMARTPIRALWHTMLRPSSSTWAAAGLRWPWPALWVARRESARLHTPKCVLAWFRVFWARVKINDACSEAQPASNDVFSLSV